MIALAWEGACDFCKFDRALTQMSQELTSGTYYGQRQYVLDSAWVQLIKVFNPDHLFKTTQSLKQHMRIQGSKY